MASGKSYEVYVQKAQPCYKSVTGVVFSNVGLFVICMAYAFIGAWAFIELELPEEEKRYELKLAKTKEVELTIDYLKTNFWLYTNDEVHNFTREEFKAEALKDLRELRSMVISYAHDYGYDMSEDWDYSWSLSKTLLFTITIITTIGYGHISPTTYWGRAFTIIYSMVGIPLLLTFMGSVGDDMAKAVRYVYSRLCCRWCRVRRRAEESSDSFTPITSDHVGTESYMPTDNILVPIMINLIIIFLFLFLGAIVFSSWEGWDLGSSVYFTFVTLTTIGFGDLTPINAFAEATQSYVGVAKVAFTVLYCIFGIMLISLALNLMQEQVVEKVRWVASEIGMNEEDEEGDNNEELVKVSKKERLKETPMEDHDDSMEANLRALKRMNKDTDHLV